MCRFGLFKLALLPGLGWIFPHVPKSSHVERKDVAPPWSRHGIRTKDLEPVSLPSQPPPLSTVCQEWLDGWLVGLLLVLLQQLDENARTHTVQWMDRKIDRWMDGWIHYRGRKVHCVTRPTRGLGGKGGRGITH